MPELQASAARDQRAAYTLFVEAHGEVRTAIAYVRRKEDDVDSIMPSLFAGRGGSKKKPVSDQPPAPVPAPITDNHSTPVVSPTPVVTPTSTAGTEPKTDPVKPVNVSASGLFMH